MSSRQATYSLQHHVLCVSSVVVAGRGMNLSVIFAWNFSCFGRLSLENDLCLARSATRISGPIGQALLMSARC